MNYEGFFGYKNSTRQICFRSNHTPVPIPSASNMLKASQQMSKITEVNSRFCVKQRNMTVYSIYRRLKLFTKWLHSRFRMSQKKAYDFQDSLLAYMHFLIEPNLQENQIQSIMEYIDNRYLFRDYPNAIGCIIGRLIIYRMDNQQEKERIKRITDQIYLKAKCDRSSCDMSKVMYLTLLDLWDQLSSFKIGWGVYDNWEHFRLLESQFDEICNAFLDVIKDVWIEFNLDQEKYEYEVAQLLKRFTNFANFTDDMKTSNLYCFMLLLRFLIDMHKNCNIFSQELIKTLKQIISKLCYIPLNPWFNHMNPILILYKIVAKEQNIFEETALKLHMALRVSQFFYKRDTQKSKISILQFEEKMNLECDFTEFYDKLDKEVEHVVELKKIVENPTQFFSYGDPQLSQRKQSYEEVFKTLHSQPSKTREPESKIKCSVIQAKPQILSYAQKKLANLEYLQLYLTLNRIHHLFKVRLDEMCKLQNNIQDRRRYIKYLYTWFGSAYLLVMKHIQSQKNILLHEGFMTTHFIQQINSELISRLAELGIVEMDFKQVYDILFQESSIEDTLSLDFSTPGLPVKQIFEAIQKLGWNVGSPTSYYYILQLRKYFNTHVTKGYGMVKDPVRQQSRQKMRLIVDLILKQKQFMINRPENAWVKANENEQQNQKLKRMEIFRGIEKLKFPENYDFKNFLIKNQIFDLQKKMQNASIGLQKDYMQIFICLITVLDHEELLLSIYANMMFASLSSEVERLVDFAQHKLHLMRKSLCAKWQPELECSQYTIDNLLCIYERFRRIEIKRERRKNSKSKPYVGTKMSTGKTKIYYERQKQPVLQESKIYQKYFEILFQQKPQEIMHFGTQLTKMGKYKEAVYVLERVNDQIKKIQLSEELNMGEEFREKINPQEMEMLKILSIECDIELCNCYAVLIQSFNKVQYRAKKQCILSRLERLKEEENEQKNEWCQRIYERINQISTPRAEPKIKTLIQKIAPRIKLQYQKNHVFYQQGKVILGQNLSKLREDDANLQFMVYKDITDYSVYEMSKLNTDEEFKIYYQNIMAGAILFEWYKERKGAMIMRCVDRIDGRDFEDSDGEEEIWSEELGMKPQSQETYELDPEREIYHLSFDNILTEFLPHVLSCDDRLTIVETMFKCEQLDKMKRPTTIRLLFQAILETDKMHLLFDLMQTSYGGQNYEMMNLFELQIFQRYFFQTKQYQQVEAITRCMKEQLEQKLYSAKPSNYICWPQVFCYDLQAKIYHGNISSDFILSLRWEEFLKLIEHDEDVLVDNKKISLKVLKKPAYLKELTLKQPTRLAKIKIIIADKIRLYFKLLRVIFDNLELQCKMGINIFLILENIFKRFFIPSLTPNEFFIDFFFYHLRFLCETVDCEWFEFEKDGQFKTQMQTIAADLDKRYPIRVSDMNINYVMLRTSNTIALLLDNLDWLKHHFMYMARSFDQRKNSKKNIILKKLLCETVLKNPAQHVWNLAFLKYYTVKFPCDVSRQLRPSGIRNQKFQQRANFEYNRDSILNMRHDSLIKDVFQQIASKLGDSKIDSLLQIPEGIMEILEQNSCQKAAKLRFSYSHPDAVNLKTKDLNNRIKQSTWRIPYPLNPDLYIKSVRKFQLIGSGKSVPTNLDFICQRYSEVKGDKYRNEKNSLIGDDVVRSFIMKFNFSNEDFMVETATANFYNEIGMLDEEITYKILNLTKYILMIEKIEADHMTMYELIEKTCDIHDLDGEGVKFAKDHDVRCDPNRISLTPGFYDNIKIQRHNPFIQNKPISLFNSFYKESIKKRSNIDQWWRYVDNFVRTLAQWSYLCYLTKLGDRHNTNILITEQGKLIHIDYEYNFSHGLVLPYPEWVPFRLTQAYISAMGTLQEKGPFFGYFLNMAKTFDPSDQKNWKALGNFQPEQRKIVQSSSKFQRIVEDSSIEDACLMTINISKRDSLLRLMYRGWLSCV